MGVLDEAIRQHLELRRAHGASEQELERQQQEALGPARRDPAADDQKRDVARADVAPDPARSPRESSSADDPLGAASPEAGAAAPPRSGPAGGEQSIDRASAGFYADSGSGQVFDVEDLASPREDAASARQRAEEAELVGEDLLDEEELDEDELAEEELAEELAGDAGSFDDEPLGPSDDDGSVAFEDEGPSDAPGPVAVDDDTVYRPPPAGDPAPEAETGEFFTEDAEPGDLAEEGYLEGEVVAEDEVLAEEPVTEVRPLEEDPLEEDDLLEEEDGLLESEDDLLEEKDDLLVGETADEDLAPGGGPGEPRPPGAASGDETAADEDVLEETPEFLQETPEDERLWFEQKPPRDFDLDR